jgi:hypothetical protein
MCSILLNFLSFCLLTLFIFNNNTICSQDNKKVDVDHDIESFDVKNDTKNVQSFNASDDYSYNNPDEEEEEEEVVDNNEKSFMDRFRLLHEEGRNVTFSKNVNHINDTVKIMKNVQKAFATLFPTDKRTNLEIMEVLTLF